MFSCRKSIRQMFMIVGLLLMYGLDCSLGEDPTVQTKLGEIKGKVISYNDEQVNAYLGVPYATPPLGDLRFKKPEAIQPWTDTIDATNYPPACPQVSSYPSPWYDNISRHDENCLYLNIWVPSTPREDRAVFYWIFSGGFTFGSNSLPVYHGQALAVAGDMIVVSVNYRLGALGFFYSASEDAPGNVGLYDSLLGLKWVNEHIEAFGGDKSRITIGGHDAGSLTSGIFSLSPLAEGLFNRAILQSGGIANYFLYDFAEINLNLGQKLAEKVNCSDAASTLRTTPELVVNCLRGIDAIELTKALNELTPRDELTFGLVKGDEMIGESPIKQLMSGDFHVADILTGVVTEEAAFQITAVNVDEFGFYGRKSDYINKSYANKLLQTEAFATNEGKNELTSYYLDDIDDGDTELIRNQTIAAFSDIFLICPTIYYAEEIAKKNQNVFFYVYKKRPSTTKWAPWMGVVHFDEVQFTFGQPIINNEEYTPDEYDLSFELLQMWTNFINNGRPDDDWPEFDSETHIAKDVEQANVTSYQEVIHLKNCDFLRPYIFKS